MGSWRYAIFALGVSMCLIGAFLMVAGESILGTDHTSIATIVGIIGIGIIGASDAIMAGALASSGRTMH